MTHLTCFKAYDIRGQLGSELDPAIAYRVGRAYASFLKPQSIVIGCDIRLSSNELKSAVTDGLIDEGVNVIDLGMTGTEEIYFAVNHLAIDGGIEITGSHNPIDYNGIKMVKDGAKPLSADTGLKQIQALTEANNFKDSPKPGRRSQKSVLGAYADHLMGYINPANFDRPLKLLINSGNGAAGHAVDAIEARLKVAEVPVEIVKMHHQADGTFPNGIPNPLLHENRSETSKAVLEHGADLGIAFDGDFDRCFLFDETGQFIEGYYIVGLLAEAFLQKERGGRIVCDPRLVWNTLELVEAAGGKAVQSKSGHSFMKEVMRRENAIYGGEMSAHHYFRDFAYCDSGMIPWLLIAELLCLRRTSLGQMVGARKHAYPSPGEINSRLDDPDAAIERVLARYKDRAIAIDYMDGIGVEFANWRFNLRKSNTEPVVRLNVESRGNAKLMQEKTDEILEVLRQQ
jgi:phosphomannomutase